jgi:hypothetical protein
MGTQLVLEVVVGRAARNGQEAFTRVYGVTEQL